MAFGKNSNTSRSYGENAKLFYFKLKTKDLPEPIFEVTQKNGDNYEVVDPAAKFVEGNLIEVRNKEFKMEKKTIKSVDLTFQDTSGGKNEVYFVSIPHTYLGRNIMNSILALKSFNNVSIGVYKSKPKPDPKNPGKMKDGFHSSAVRQDGALVYGKFKNEELPKIPKVEVGGEMFSDTKNITEFFTKQIEEFAKQLKAAAPTKAATDAEPEGAAVGHDSEGDDKDIPF